jgi:hypothetical protein
VFVTEIDCDDAPLGLAMLAHSAEDYFGPDKCNGDIMLREPYAPVFARLFRRYRERKSREVVK